MYGLTETEINELKGIKRDGETEIKKVKTDMKEALEDMQHENSQQHDSDSSDEEQKEGDIEGNNNRKHRTRKTEYVCKFKVCNQKVKVDKCLCMRLILAGAVMMAIIGAIVAMITLDAKLKEER